MGDMNVAPPPGRSALDAAVGGKRWKIGDYLFDPAARTLQFAGRSERISHKAAQVLLRLVGDAGKVVGRQQLIDEVWAGNAYTGSRALTHTVCQLRRSLEGLAQTEPTRLAEDPDSEGPIETISKSGYRLRLAVSAAPEVPATGTATAADANDQPELSAFSVLRRRTGPLWLVAGLALLLVFGAAALANRWLQKTADPHLARGPQPITTSEGVESHPSYSPDGHTLAYLAYPSQRRPQLRIIDSRHPEATPHEIFDDRDQMASPVWVDQHHIAYLEGSDGQACRVVLVDLQDDSHHELSECLLQRGVAPLTASPDGQWLAFLRTPDDSNIRNVILHRLSDGAEHQLLRVPGDDTFATLDWSRDGHHIAALQLTTTVSKIAVIDVASGELTALTRREVPMLDVRWGPADRSVLFSAVIDGQFAIWQVPVTGGTPTVYAPNENVSNFTLIPDGSGDITATVARYEDHIERYSLQTGAHLDTLRSAGRDLYPAYCGDSDHVLFVSTRGRDIGLWYQDGKDAEARRLHLPDGIPSPGYCSPNGQRFATILTPTHPGPSRLLIGELAPGGTIRQFASNDLLQTPNWSLDGQTLILSRIHAGSIDLWRFDPETGTYLRLTECEGQIGREVRVDGQMWLYFSRADENGLWRMPLTASGKPAGIPNKVLDDLQHQDSGNWQWHDGALWRISRDRDGDHLVRRDPQGLDQTVLSLPAMSVGPFLSMGIDARGIALIGTSGPAQADLTRLPGRDRTH